MDVLRISASTCCPHVPWKIPPANAGSLLRTEYGDLVGMQLGCRSGLLPSSEALRLRYKLFVRKLEELA
jgi:hypothetical protein